MYKGGGVVYRVEAWHFTLWSPVHLDARMWIMGATGFDGDSEVLRSVSRMMCLRVKKACQNINANNDVEHALAA